VAFSFIEPAFAPRAFQDISLPIGYGQTISRPSTVAAMLASLRLRPGERVLEVGFGCGYVLALLAALGAQPYGIEKVPSLAQRTRRRLDAMGLQTVIVRFGEGRKGWPELAPFDAVICSCAFDQPPQELFSQLSESGRLVAPVIDDPRAKDQQLRCWRRASSASDRFLVQDIMPCQFVVAQ